MALHKKSYSQFENQSVKQDFDKSQHSSISGNAFDTDANSDNELNKGRDYYHEVVYHDNLDDWQG